MQERKRRPAQPGPAGPTYALAARAILASLLAMACTGGTAPAPRAETGFAGTFVADLLGDWYVLVHYQDAVAQDAAQWHWDERVWRFSPEDHGVRWAVHPLVDFRDTRGRFEILPGGERARSLGAWTPAAEQRTEIEEGLRFGAEGSVSKLLRGTPEAGYRSHRRSRSDSASTIDYAERWSIESPAGLPVFTRDVSMGAARVEAAEGRTRYTALERSPDGAHLRGRYVRDDAIVGVFELFRMGPRGAAGAGGGR